MHCDDFSSQAVSPNTFTNSEIQKIIDAIDADTKLSRADIKVAVEILNLSRDDGYAYVSIADIAEIGRCAERTAVNIRKRLVERGYFRVEKGGGAYRPNRFFPLKIPITARRRRVTL